MDVRKLVAETVGTAILVIIAVGVATLSFGFKFAGLSISAGVVATALAFGLVLMALVYVLGPISGCHVNPAVTVGFLVSGQMGIAEAVGYWVAQFVGGILGALVLWGLFSASPLYTKSRVGLGADGYGAQSMVHISQGGAIGVEVVLTFVFVFVVLGATSKLATPSAAGLAIGVGLALVHLIGIPLTGTSVNPARSFGPALVLGGTALKQVWVFLVAPAAGGAVAALLYRVLFPASLEDADRS